MKSEENGCSKESSHMMVNGHEEGFKGMRNDGAQAEKQQFRSVFFRKITIQDLSEQHL